MKCNPLRWLWGLLPIAALTYVVAQVEHAGIEDDLSRRVEAELKGTGLRWARSGFSGRDGLITGKATDETDPQKAIDAASRVWGVRIVNNGSDLVERADAYTWWATLADRRVTLRGLVPNDATRETIVVAARSMFPGSPVNDEMRLARGVPNQETWLTGVSFGMKQLQGLKAGEARLDALGLSVAGEAASQASYSSVKTALASGLPRGIRLTDDRVTPPVIKPYIWAAKASGSQVTITGNVPNARVRSEVETVAREAFPRVRPTDRTEFGDGAPPGFLSVISSSLRDLAKLEEGSATLTDTTLAVEGLAADEVTANAVRRSLRTTLPQNYRLVDQIRFQAPPLPPPAAPPPAPAVVSPYASKAVNDGSRLVLSGHAPNEAAKAQIEQSARARFTRRGGVDNRLVLAPGAPEGWQGCFDSGLAGVARLEEGSVTVTDMTLTLDGLAADEAQADRARGALKSSLPQTCRLVDQIRVQPPSGGYTSRAQFDGSSVLLLGQAPNEAAKAQIEQSARIRFPGSTITNNLAIAPGAPADWIRCFDAGLLALARLGGGSTVVTDRRLDIAGTADEEDLVTAVPADVRSRVQNACDVNATIVYRAPQEPDTRWSAKREGDLVLLSGPVTSSSTRIALLAQARRQFPNVQVRDDMTVVENKSKNWPRAAEVALASLAEVDTGEAVVQRQSVSVSGETRYEPSIIERVREKLRRDLPRGYSGREQITMLRPPVQQPVQTPVQPPARQPVSAAPAIVIPPPPVTPAAVACQERLRETARAGTISFDRARALLTGSSTQTLDRIAQIARTCPRVKIEIGGHTDSEGTPERNQNLSDRRAQAVRDYLSRVGVDVAMLSAVGYGETRPLVPNDTPDNRARNRRIEFTVTE